MSLADEPIYFVLEGRNRILRPHSFINALRGFAGLLREIDASVSHEQHGSVTWEIFSLQKSSPATIGYRAIPKKHKTPKFDYTAEIKRTCVTGLDVLSKRPDRIGAYSDRALDRTEYLAKLRTNDRFDDMRVIAANQEAIVGVQTLAHIQTLRGPAYESLGSVIGTLEAITVRHAFEFRVWSDMTGKPVTCRFREDLLDRVKASLRGKVVVNGMVKWNALGHPISVAVDDLEPAQEDRVPTIEEMSGLVSNFTEGMPLGDWLEEMRNG